MIKGYRYLWIFLVFMVLLASDGITVWASPEDAALCKKYASDKYPSPIFAIEPCTRQVESNPEDFESVFWRGVAYYKRGSTSQNDYQLAVADFNRVLEVYPNDMQALENRASCYLELKRYAEAIVDASEIIATDDKALGAYMVRAKAYVWLSRYEEGVSDYTIAIALNPRNERTKYTAYSWRGQCYKYLKKYEQALADYKTALKINPGAYYEDKDIAECLTKLGRKRDAIEAWQDLIAIIDRDSSKSKDSFYLKEKASARTEIEKLSK